MKTSPSPDNMSDVEWIQREFERFSEKQRRPTLIKHLCSNYRFVRFVYKTRLRRRLWRALFGSGGLLSPDRKAERSYKDGGKL